MTAITRLPDRRGMTIGQAHQARAVHERVYGRLAVLDEVAQLLHDLREEALALKHPNDYEYRPIAALLGHELDELRDTATQALWTLELRRQNDADARLATIRQIHPAAVPQAVRRAA